MDAIPKLLRAIAGGIQAKENRHDVIFLAAAAKIEQLEAALNYVADMTYCGADAEWHFKPGYDPQTVLGALAGKEG